jgi:hypothetical protein
LKATAADPWLTDCAVAPELSKIFSRGQWGNDVIEIMKSLLNKCRKISVGEFAYEEYMGTSDKGTAQKLNSIIDSGQPSIINFCAEVLYRPQYRGIKKEDGGIWDRNSRANTNDNCGNHSSLVTGKRLINGSCQYLIRNSWGSNWAPKHLSCACKTSQKYYPDCPKTAKTEAEARELSERVYVGCWVPASDLVPNIQTLGQIK